MSNFGRRLGVLATVASLSSGCGATVSSPCPPLVNYTEDFSRKLAKEIEAMLPGMVTPDVIADYMTLRDQVRACRQEGR